MDTLTQLAVATDDDLLLRFQHTNDAAALAMLHDRYSRALHLYAQKHLPHSLAHEADDVVQEAFADFCEKRTTFKPGGVSALLYRIVRRGAVRHCRRARVRGFGRTVSLQSLGGYEPVDKRADPAHAEARIDATTHLHRLSHRRRKALQLTRLDGHTAASAAKAMNLSASSVRKLAARGLQELRCGAGET
jgi:RNA polymerase sigma factor (sigma-70 family)